MDGILSFSHSAGLYHVTKSTASKKYLTVITAPPSADLNQAGIHQIYERLNNGLMDNHGIFTWTVIRPSELANVAFGFPFSREIQKKRSLLG